MRKIHVELKGVTPLLMNDCKVVNPLNPITREKAKYTSKRKKTEEDYLMISDLDWEGSIYWNDEVGPYIPAENIEACVREGAKNCRKGSAVTKGFNVVDLMNPLNYGENKTLEELKNDYSYRDVRSVVVQRARVIRTRARFERWSVGFDAIYDENVLNVADLVSAIDYAGNYVGLCDSRPKYGKFVATITELD